MKAAVLALAALCLNAQAMELPEVVGVHAVSYHFGPDADRFNNVNPGLYARWNNGFTLGTYYNSERKETFYVAWTLTDKDDRFALTIGAASGYQRATLAPLVVPSVRLELNEKYSLRLSVAAGKDAGAVHLSFEGRF